MVIRTKIKFAKKNGYKKFFRENAVALINKQENPVGTRILGPMPKDLKKKKNYKNLLVFQQDLYKFSYKITKYAFFTQFLF